MPRFDPEAILRALNRHRVESVLIGGLAATLHGSLRTGDADIYPSLDDENLGRLANALNELEARMGSADAPEGLPFARDAKLLSNERCCQRSARGFASRSRATQ